MSVIEDTRKVMQDFLAPELRGISARLDALEQRFGSVDKRLDGLDHKFDEVERRSEKRHDEVLAAIARMSDYSSLLERVARLESSQRPAQ